MVGCDSQWRGWGHWHSVSSIPLSPLMCFYVVPSCVVWGRSRTQYSDPLLNCTTNTCMNKICIHHTRTHTHTHKQTGIHTHKQTGIHKKVHLALRVGRHLALSVGRHLALSVGRGKGGDKAQGWSSLLAARMGLPTRQTGAFSS